MFALASVAGAAPVLACRDRDRPTLRAVPIARR
jgi:hypothetical protein